MLAKGKLRNLGRELRMEVLKQFGSLSGSGCVLQSIEKGINGQYGNIPKCFFLESISRGRDGQDSKVAVELRTISSISRKVINKYT